MEEAARKGCYCDVDGRVDQVAQGDAFTTNSHFICKPVIDGFDGAQTKDWKTGVLHHRQHATFTASVFPFNRITRSLLHLMQVLLGVIGGVFYDDFALLEPSAYSRICSMAAERLLEALGWKFAKEGDKPLLSTVASIYLVFSWTFRVCIWGSWLQTGRDDWRR